MNEDKSSRYHGLRRRAGLASVGLSAGLMVLLAWSGAAIWLREAATRFAAIVDPPAWAVTSTVVAAFVCLLGALDAVLSFPFDFYRGFVLERRYGLSTQQPGRWLVDHAKSALVGGALAVLSAVAIYALIEWWPGGWFVGAAAGAALMGVALAWLAPVCLLPFFYTFRRLERETLRSRLVAMAARAGIEVIDAYEWQLSGRTSRANAALTGLGRTRRILVSDTLLGQFSDDEIEVVLAHEIAHHARNDIWRGIGFESVFALAAFVVADLTLRGVGPLMGLIGPADVAGLPVIALAVGLSSAAGLPAANALSRVHERAADRFALDLTRNAEGFVSAIRRLGARNLAEQSPSRMVRWFFHSHPTVPERIAAAREWMEREGAALSASV